MDVPLSVLRTRALFEAEKLLQEIAAYRGRGSWQEKARKALTHYPSHHELMRICEDHPMLDASEAQTHCDTSNHLAL